MNKRNLIDRVAAPFLFALLAFLQLSVFVRGEFNDSNGRWFLFGTDTVYHDAIVHRWVQQWWDRDPGTIPLWMPELHGGLPTLGAFLWTPLAPPAWPLLAMDYPEGQRLGWMLALFIAGCGGYLLARALKIRPEFALISGVGWMLAGHLVTLIHAGHFQKVMALSWLPWAAAGAVMATAPHCAAMRWRGVAIGTLGIGMTLLCGHPQVTYMALGLVGLWTLWQLLFRRAVRVHFARHLAITAVIAAAGMCLGGAQLISGLEMSSMSNRAGGVGIEEAVETSYPPGELAELFIPRVKGSNVRGDTYTGDWGERIVSDYAGKLLLLLALCAALVRRIRRLAAWFWFVTATLSLVVGVGRYTPAYELLYRFLPGLSSFRSPGTFMAVACLSFPVLAAFGMEGIHYRLRSAITTPRSARLRLSTQAVAIVLLLVASVDLMTANRHFLIAEQWDRFAAYLAPNPAELALMESGRIVEYYDEARPLSLRPILYGAATPLGYHPITFPRPDAMEPDPQLPPNAQAPNRLVIREGRIVETNLTPEAAFASLATTESDASARRDWRKRFPNERVLGVPEPPGVLTVRERILSGWEVSSADQTLVTTASQPNMPLLHRIELPGDSDSVTWRYRPPAWRVGLWLTVLGALFASGAGACSISTSRRRSARSRRSNPT